MPWAPSTPRRAAERAVIALLADPARSDAAIAADARTSATTVARVRATMPGYDVPRVPRPRPRRGWRTTLAIIAGATSPRQVADMAGISYQAAWKALNPYRPATIDAAGAADLLTVTVRAPLADLGAADGLLHTATGRRREPRIPDLPPAPDFARGLCTTSPPAQRMWWTSADRTDREAAQRMCATCPVRTPCEAWALAAGERVLGSAIYAGMSGNQRRIRRRELLAAIARQVRG